VDWSSDVCSSDLCRGNPLLTTDFGNCAYRYSAATDLLPQSSEASGMVSFTKSLPANNQLQVQYFYTQSKVSGWAGPMFYALPISPTNPFLPTASRLTCLSPPCSPLNETGFNGVYPPGTIPASLVGTPMPSPMTAI